MSVFVRFLCCRELRLSVMQCVSASLQDKNKSVLERDSERLMAPTVLSILMKDSGRWLLCPNEGQSLRTEGAILWQRRE